MSAGPPHERKRAQQDQACQQQRGEPEAGADDIARVRALAATRKRRIRQTMAHPQSLRPFVMAGMVAVVVVTVWAPTAPRALMPPVFAARRAADLLGGRRSALVLLEPVLHAPWFGSVTAPARWSWPSS